MLDSQNAAARLLFTGSRAAEGSVKSPKPHSQTSPEPWLGVWTAFRGQRGQTAAGKTKTRENQIMYNCYCKDHQSYNLQTLKPECIEFACV